MGLEKFAHSLDLPASAVTRAARMEIFGNSEVLLEGLRRVVAYEEGVIQLDLGKKYVTFQGEGLCIRSLENGAALLEGNLLRIEFSSPDSETRK